MLQNVDKQLLRTRRIFRNPIPDAFHVMSLEDRISVIAEVCFQSIHLAWVNVVHAQFVNMM